MNWDDIRRVLMLEDYNTRIVVFGTTLLGMAAGIVGTFTLLRRRALMGDALSHATLPGIGLAFLIGALVFGRDKSLPLLLCGAALTGVLGVAAILTLRNLTRIKEDAALGIVLSVFFGAGAAILGMIQGLESGHAAGLESFIYGKTASMIAADVWLIGVASIVCALAGLVLFKELRLLCFDEAFAGSLGFPLLLLDVIMMTMVILVTIIGLQAVGLVLMIALLVIPAAAARFWTARMAEMTVCAALLGAASGALGSAVSALLPRLPSGATIVIVAACLFVVSLLGGVERGLVVRLWRRRRLNARIDRQHVLRSLYELLESRGQLADVGRRPTPAVPMADLLAHRSWSPGRLMSQVRKAVERGDCLVNKQGGVVLTAEGGREAARLVREHRLWEMYLITHADIAPSKVDRDADTIEHVLDAEMIGELESLLQQRPLAASVVKSPHPIESSTADNHGE
jgi:manganese/zinc/iron transport system permease protein